jgi:hypothetical protein
VAPLQRVGARGELGQAPEPAPDAGRRPLFEQQLVSAPREHEPGFAPGPRLARARRRECVLPVRRACDATRVDRTEQAGRVAASAERRTQVHDALRVCSDLRHRRTALRQRPELLLDRWFARVALDREIAGEDTLDVAVENGVTLAARQRKNGAGGRAPDARQRHGLFERRGKFAAVPLHDRPGRAMQMTRPRVIAEPGPEVQHLVERRRREPAHVGEAREEPLVVPGHGGDLGLLQHDLGNPDAVRRAIALPGQVLAPFALIPAQQGGRELGGGAHDAQTIATSPLPARQPSGKPYCFQ